MSCTYVSQKISVSNSRFTAAVSHFDQNTFDHLKSRVWAMLLKRAFLFIGMHGCLMPMFGTTFRQVSRNLLLDCFEVHVPRSFSDYTYRMQCPVFINTIEYFYTCHYFCLRAFDCLLQFDLTSLRFGSMKHFPDAGNVDIYICYCSTILNW